MMRHFAKELLKAAANAGASALGTAIGTHLGNQVVERWLKPRQASPAGTPAPPQSPAT